jgi:hypothetical protein
MAGSPRAARRRASAIAMGPQNATASGTIPDHGRLGPSRREGAQETSPPDEAGGDKYETERYEQESAGIVTHLPSLHHSRGDRHARADVTLPISERLSVSEPFRRPPIW